MTDNFSKQLFWQCWNWIATAVTFLSIIFSFVWLILKYDSILF